MRRAGQRSGWVRGRWDWGGQPGGRDGAGWGNPVYALWRCWGVLGVGRWWSSYLCVEAIAGLSQAAVGGSLGMLGDLETPGRPAAVPITQERDGPHAAGEAQQQAHGKQPSGFRPAGHGQVSKSITVRWHIGWGRGGVVLFGARWGVRRGAIGARMWSEEQCRGGATIWETIIDSG